MANTVAMNPPQGSGVVECQPDQVDYFESIGWKRVETAKATRKPKAIKPKSEDDK